MLDLLLNLGSFMLGMSIGKAQVTNADIIKERNDMQDLIDQAYESRDAMRSMWLEAEEKAESWKRRYDNLLPLTQTSFEE